MRTKEWYGKLKTTHDVDYVPASGTSTATSVSLDAAEVQVAMQWKDNVTCSMKTWHGF